MEQTEMHKRFQWLVLFIITLSLASPLYAHTINYALEKAPTQHVVWYYLKLGIKHIIPEGFDHILFVVSLCLLSTKIKTICQCQFCKQMAKMLFIFLWNV